ncbi:MAG: MBL fold metallo-hydrolase [Candidatus Tectomicrobia bacterium]|nr:MBL fold metallo-hydrolase [Candidatus Tectomicrobia bacterium]
MPDYVYSFRLGSATLTIISEGTLKWAASSAFGDASEEEWRPLAETDSEGDLTCGMNIVHVAIHDHSILCDTGIGEPHPSRTNFEASFPIVHTPGLIPCLASIGVQPEQITEILFSHTHGDHIMGTTVERNGQRVPAFPHARYILTQTEWAEAPARTQPDSTFNLHLLVLQARNLMTLVEDRYEVTKGVHMIPSPGESPGHAIIRIESEGKTAFYLGDLFHHPAEVIHPDWAPRGRDKARLLASREALVAEALDTDALLITAHMPFPGMGKLQRRHRDSVEWVSVGS